MLQQQKRTLKGNFEQTNAAGLRLSDEDNAEYEQLKAQFAEATAERQSEIDNYNRQLKTQEDRVSTLNSKHQQLKIRESNLSAEVAELQSQNVQKEETIADIDTHYNELSQKHAELVEERKNEKLERNLFSPNSRKCLITCRNIMPIPKRTSVMPSYAK